MKNIGNTQERMNIIQQTVLLNKEEFKSLEYFIGYKADVVYVQPKQALNELKEIGDYQAQRIQELNNENTHIKTTIQTMIKNERTAIGQSVLQQLWEQIQ